MKMDRKAKVSNFIKLLLMSFLKSSEAKFDTVIGKIFILQLERESEAENEKRKRVMKGKNLQKELNYP